MNNDFILDYNLKIWIFIPIYNFDKFLDECFNSVYNQTYKNYKIYIIDDASTDDSKKIIEKWIPLFQEKSIQVILERLSSNMGSGYTKWSVINYIKKTADKNDIFTILDGDDSYIGDHALETIIDAYIKKKCWFTYGSSIGPFSDQQKQITKEYIKNMRKIENQRLFPFTYPISCKIFLLDYMYSSDFQDKNNKWLLRVTDKEFIFKCVELSGTEKTYFITEKIYNYRQHANNCRNFINQNYKEEQIYKISVQKPLEPINEKIHIVMCCYARHHHLSTIINAIDNQTVASKIVFHIINTNPEKWNDTVLIKNNTPVKNIILRLCNTGSNLYGYSRFLYTKYLLKTEIISYIIFIDDDQILPPEWIEKLYKIRCPLIYSCQYGCVFKKYKTASEYNYWNRTFTNIDGNYNKILPNSLDYGGTCGCIVDTNIFLFSIFFKCPKQYRNVEDLWLSYIVNFILGKNIQIFPISLGKNIISDREETAMWKKIIEHKIDFLRLLVNTGFLISKIGVNNDELVKILEPEDDSELSISKFIFE